VPKAPLIFVSAGEASGDHYGAELITALKAVLPDARFTGLGGTAMEVAGQQRVIRAEDVAVMGITEILRHIPRILASYRKLVRSIKQQRPDVAVLIDFPDVNFRLAKHLKQMGVPVIWFVSPQLWAWKRGRLRWVQQRVSKMLTIFPFEQPFYAARGVEAEFVGHPLAEAPLPSISRAEYALQATQLTQQQWAYFSGTPEWIKDRTETTGYPLDPAQPYRHSLDIRKPWVALLPGSRLGEIHAHLQILIQTAARLDASGEYEFLVPIASSAEKDLEGIQHATGEYYLQSNPPRITFVRDARSALLHSRAAVVASGTATVQAAVIGTPFVTVYRVSKLTFAAAKRLVRYPAEIPAEKDAHGNLPIAMVNLIAGRRVVPELLQEQFTAENIVAHLKPLLEDGPERAAQIEALAEVRQKLQSPTGQTAIERVRDAVLTALDAPAAPVYPAAPSASND
jgi:lipid-A-disaccharide synthase